MENTKVSDLQIIEDAVRTLNNIRMPVSQANDALQIWRVATNLNALADIIKEQCAQMTAAEETKPAAEMEEAPLNDAE